MVETAQQVASIMVWLLLAGNVLVVGGAALVEFAPRSCTFRLRAIGRLLTRATGYCRAVQR